MNEHAGSMDGTVASPRRGDGSELSFLPLVHAILRVARQVQLSFLALAASLAMMCCGCVLTRSLPSAMIPPYRPQNVFVWGSGLPAEIRRVALLPMSCEEGSADMVEGRDALEPIIQNELAKTHRFELIKITPEALRSRTGQAAWTSEDILPADLFAWLKETRGCDAVLFCRLTVFRGYAPLAVGWRMRLVDTRSRSTIWAGDEIFDATLPSVQAGARHFQLAQRPNPGHAAEEWIIENSPRQFGEYAASRLLASLPAW